MKRAPIVTDISEELSAAPNAKGSANFDAEDPERMDFSDSTLFSMTDFPVPLGP